MASIRKRGENSYLIVVSRGYDYEGNRLKSAQKTVHPPMELKPKQREKRLQEQAVLFEREVHHTPEPVNKSITLAKYIDHWLAEVAPKKLAKTTYSRDQQDVRRILPALGYYKLTDLRKEVIRDFYEEMRKAPKLTDGKPLSEKSVEGIHNTLCSILSDAVEEGYLLHNPVWKMYKPQGEKKERPVADEELVQRLITALEGQSLKYETYFKLVLATGMRRGEACGVRWSDINWKKRSIHIQRNVVKLSHEPIFVKPPKTASGDRVVYISKEMAKLLKSWKQQCMWECKQNDEVLQEDDYLFRQPSGDPMVPTTFTFRFKKNSAAKWPAGESERTQFAAHKRQFIDRPRGGRPHGSQPVGPFPGQYDTGHLCPCVRQEEAGSPGETGGGDGAVISEERMCG